LRYFEKKTVFGKSLSGPRGRKNVLTWVEVRLKYLTYLGIGTKCWTPQSGQSPKLGVGVFFAIFRTPVSQKLLEISKCAQQGNYYELKYLQI